MEDNNYSVYVHEFPDQKYYVGLTRQTPESRWGTNGVGYKTQYVYEAILNFGWDNIRHYIINSGMTAKEAAELEEELIDVFDSYKNGYNRTEGGEIGGSCKKYKYNNKEYSIYELIEDKSINIYDINYACVKNRLAHDWTIEEIFSMPQPEKYNLYEYQGHMYTVYDLAKINGTGITPHGIQTRINRGMSIENAVNTPLKEKIQSVIYDDKEYSLSELARTFGIDGIDNRTLSCRLQRGWSLERALTQSKNVKVQPFGIGERCYEYEGKMYNSYELTKIHPELNLTVGDITNRINRRGWSVDRAITQPKKKMGITFIYNNVEYDSHGLANICVDQSMTYHDVTDRNRHGWTTWEIVNIPKGMTRSQYYRKNEHNT